MSCYRRPVSVCPENAKRPSACLIPEDLWIKRPLYKECTTCKSAMITAWLGELQFKHARCGNKACETNMPLAFIIGGPPHMSLPTPCGRPGCCDGRPWWWPDRAGYLDMIRPDKLR